MLHFFRWSALILGLLLLAEPLPAQKPKPGNKGTSATPQEYQQVLATGEITGKVARIDHRNRLITVAVEVPTAQQGGGKPNQNGGQDLARQRQQMARQMMQRPNNRNPAEQARQMAQQVARLQQQQMQALARNAGNPPKVQTVRKEFEFQADEKAKVRLMSLPQEYDDRGKPKQYTAAELRELKGPNSSLPGYQADFENLTVGQLVKLTVASPRKSSSAKPVKKDADLEGGGVMPLDATKPRATMVQILKAESGTQQGKGDPKKKK